MTNLLPYAFARDFMLLARTVEASDHAAAALSHSAEVWVCAATSAVALAEVSRRFGRIAIKTMPHSELEAAIARAYAGAGGDASMVADEFDADLDLTKLLQDVPAIEDLLESSDDAPVIRMINALLTQALREGASDIHIEPFEQTSVVRFRIDGSLRDVVRPRKAIHGSLISRIKIMAQLDIAEKRLPQDGRITLRVGGKPVDVRVSTLPTGHGERAVLRLLDKEAGRLDLQHLGMNSAMLAQFDGLIKQPHGIVLVTGPTGSGKSTTLAAIIDRINETRAEHILTIEDPIEFLHNHKMGTVHQRELHSDTPTFSAALRAALRQAPKVILVGEMRDRETIEIALTAAETGHLVFSTLHTIDASKTADRIVNTFEASDQHAVRVRLAATFRAFISQRLIPKKAGGRIAVLEILKSTMRTREYIEQGETEGKSLIDAMKDGTLDGMQTFDGELERLVRDGTIAIETAMLYASNAGNLRVQLFDV